MLDDRLQALREADEVRQAEQAKQAVEQRAKQDALEAQRAEVAQVLARRLETVEGELQAVPQRFDVLERQTEAPCGHTLLQVLGNPHCCSPRVV